MPLPPTSCGHRVWDEFLGRVRDTVDSRSFAAWFQGLEPEDIDEQRLGVIAPNPFVKQAIESRFLSVVEGAARACLGPTVQLSIRCCPASPSPPAAPAPSDPERPEPHPPRPAGSGPHRTPGSAPLPEPDIHCHLNDRYVFENFVVGPSNQLSHAACLQVVSAPAAAYNPLFIHAPSGMGKTHLLQATCHALRARSPSPRVLYISCEDFINRFVEALKAGTLPAYRQGLRRLDCLAVDDIHFLAGKKRMQEEFFFTFNALHDHKKQIILSSDSKPRDMSHFEERLLSRFQWGLLTSIGPPDRDMRVAIADRMALAHDQTFPRRVADFVAEIAARNVRELEGAVNKLLAIANLEGREINLDLARRALGDPAGPPHVPTPHQIASAVASRYGVSPADLRSPRRSRSFLIPRQISMYLIKSMTDSSLREIGAYFGGRDHTTVINALNRAAILLEQDDTIRHDVDLLVEQLRPPGTSTTT